MDRKTFRAGLYRLQQRIALTSRERNVLVGLTVFLLAGLGASEVQRRSDPFPEAIYAADDRLFAERSAALQAAVLPDTNRTPAPDSTGRTTRDSTGPSDVSSDGRIDLNAATQAQLETLPRIGPKTAERILAYRAVHGPFRRVDDLLDVRGIGPATLERLRPLVRVRSP